MCTILFNDDPPSLAKFHSPTFIGYTGLITKLERPRWPNGKVSTSGLGGSQVRNPIPPKIRRVWDLLHAKSYVVAKRPPVDVAWKLGEGLCQVRCGVVPAI
ncbi:hypothetical protein AVEN_113299-1 [Araneus ventricosus]|uniref:Uncharacterized protein n=1 Tax=Araneus ventricosus TaxID=182803 RepID=A0A4Y2GMW1_ARAVE|nr:hypothetical protein AVEN_113299-1 [Araneus ventricosus]